MVKGIEETSALLELKKRESEELQQEIKRLQEEVKLEEKRSKARWTKVGRVVESSLGRIEDMNAFKAWMKGFEDSGLSFDKSGQVKGAGTGALSEAMGEAEAAGAEIEAVVVEDNAAVAEVEAACAKIEVESAVVEGKAAYAEDKAAVAEVETARAVEESACAEMESAVAENKAAYAEEESETIETEEELEVEEVPQANLAAMLGKKAPGPVYVGENGFSILAEAMNEEGEPESVEQGEFSNPFLVDVTQPMKRVVVVPEVEAKNAQTEEETAVAEVKEEAADAEDKAAIAEIEEAEVEDGDNIINFVVENNLPIELQLDFVNAATSGDIDFGPILGFMKDKGLSVEQQTQAALCVCHGVDFETVAATMCDPSISVEEMEENRILLEKNARGEM